MFKNPKHATTNFKMLLPFIKEAEKHDGYLKCKSAGFMDLVVEKLYYEDVFNNPVFSISHYGVQNGDAMADPDVTYSVNFETGTVIPLSFRNDYMGIEQEVFRGDMYSRKLMTELDDFLWHWLQTIDEQGFKPVQA